MIKNYFKTAWRNIIKNKVHSFINIVGLSIGMSVAMLIGLWIWNELSFDRFTDNYRDIARVIQNVTNNGEVQTWQAVPYPLADEIRKSYGSDFKHVVMIAGGGDHTLALDTKKLTRGGAFMENEGPEMFSLKMLKGRLNVLSDPTSIMISASTAKAFFADGDPMGKTLKIDNQITAKVAGVYADFPQNSSFSNFTFLGSWKMFYNANGIKDMREPWRPNFTALYVQMRPNADIAALSLKIRDAKLRNVSAVLAKKKPALFLHPMNKWHLYDDFRDGKNVGGGIQYVWMFGITGAFVLLLACINFMNLSTARSEKRAREVGIRKAVGSLRGQLIYQFFSESILCVFFAFALALFFVKAGLPLFNEVANKRIDIPWAEPTFWLSAFGFCLFTGFVAGSYPAFYLSSFNPVKVLKGTFRVGRLAALPRKVLVVVQFTASITLIIGTIVVFNQIQYAKDRPVGYSRDGLVSIPVGTDAIHKQYEAVKDELLKTGAIVSMAEGDVPPTTGAGSTSAIEWRDKDPNLSVDFQQAGVAADYGKTAGWQFREGRDFSNQFLTDSSAVVINEAAVKFMGMKNPLIENVTYYGNRFRIIGVIKDIITDSPYGQVKPAVFFLNKGPGGTVLLRIKPQISTNAATQKIEPIFKRFNPDQPFQYNFVDELYAQKFGDEQRIGRLAAFFAGLAIFISCLGLFGMASFMAEQRIKEIGVRKVLGASVFNLWRLLSTDFIALVFTALIIASPVAWYLMHGWLQHFDYRSSISGWIFVLTGLGALSITLITVSFQSIKAALANPIRSLKTE